MKWLCREICRLLARGCIPRDLESEGWYWLTTEQVQTLHEAARARNRHRHGTLSRPVDKLWLVAECRETGAWRCMAATPADHLTGGYRVATEPPVPEPAYDPPERFDGTASVPVREWWDAPDWRQAQSDFA